MLHVTEKDLRKLNRYQLLELLVVQTERLDRLQAELDDTKKKLEDQDMKVATLGSIAEASLQLNGVFKAAQDAADTYVNAAKKHASEIEESARRNAEDILQRAREEARLLKGDL